MIVTMCNQEGCTREVTVQKRGLCKIHFNQWAKANKPRAGFVPCEVAGCEKTNYARGYCNKHYANFQRCGDPLGIRATLIRPKCEQEDCEKEVKSRGLCASHYRLMWLATREIKPFDPSQQSKKVGYSAAHDRVRSSRGFPSSYDCACGCGKPGEQWALIAGTENVLYGALSGRTTQTAYSLNPYDYQSMTSACHKAYDAATGNRNYKTGKYASVSA